MVPFKAPHVLVCVGATVGELPAHELGSVGAAAPQYCTKGPSLGWGVGWSVVFFFSFDSVVLLAKVITVLVYNLELNR